MARKLRFKYRDNEKHTKRVTVPMSTRMYEKLSRFEKKLVKTGAKRPSRIKVNYVIRALLHEGLKR